MRKGGDELPKKVAVDAEAEQAMIKLGALICECRGTNSLRAIAKPSGIPASQLQYIERGTMAPTDDVYPNLIAALHPDKLQRTQMDELYMAIRKTPPPNICNTIISSRGLVEALGAFEGSALSDIQVQKLKALLTSFAEERKGETDNVETL